MSPRKEKDKVEGDPEPETPQPNLPARTPSDEEKFMAMFLEGDIKDMTPTQRMEYCWRLAKSVGLNPLTKPFDILNLGGKTVIYANRTAADQIRANRGITSKILYHGPLVLGQDKEGHPIFRQDVYQVIVELTDKEKRTETATGCVNVNNFQGEALSNQIMKCWTKAMRRGTLSMGGLGFLDELEVESVKPSFSPNSPDDYQPVAPKLQTAPTLAPSPIPLVEAVIVDAQEVAQSAPVVQSAPTTNVLPMPAPVPSPVPTPQKTSGPRPLPKVQKPERGV